MRKSAGFTLLEMIIATAVFAAGSLYIYSTFAGVSSATQTATMEMDLSGQNKKALTEIYNDLQATSLTDQDTDGLDSTDPVPVFIVEDDGSAPAPKTDPRTVDRSGAAGPTEKSGTWSLGAKRQEAREHFVPVSKRIRFRKVTGFRFNAGPGTVIPVWSPEITYRIDDKNRLVREVAGGGTREIAQHVDALDAHVSPDGTVLVTLVTARRNPNGHGWRRVANSVTVHPKN